MSDFGDKSGVSSAKGYDYQRLIAAYYLIVKKAREIEYEADGEDITIINEDPNRDSIEYIQAKCKSTGSFTLAMFKKDVFPQFWNAFSKASEKNPDKAIRCTLFTNVAWDLTLKKFINGCKLIYERGLTLNDFERSMKIADRTYHSMKGNKDRDQFLRFLWGLKMEKTFPPDHVKEKISSYMSSCGISEPRLKLALVINHISEIGQGRITRRQIEDLVDNKLTPLREASDKPIYSEAQIGKILSGLETVKSKYRTEKELPDKEFIYRSMTSPVEKASKLFINQLEEKGRTSDSSTTELQEACEIILSDAQKAKEEAQTVAGLKSELYIHEIGYTQRISSMRKTARDFGIEL